MSNSFALREYTIPPRRETRSPLGFSDKSAKKSCNFRWYAQKPSILPRSCPTCWDVTMICRCPHPDNPRSPSAAGRGHASPIQARSWPSISAWFGRGEAQFVGTKIDFVVSLDLGGQGVSRWSARQFELSRCSQRVLPTSMWVHPCTWEISTKRL
jgi:hypothetical protein